MGIRVASFVMMQIGWFACVLGAAWDRAALGAAIAGIIVVINVLLAPDRQRAAVLVIGLGAVAPLADLLVIRLGYLSLSGGLLAGVWPPIWWMMLWMLFASTLYTSFSWLLGRPGLAAVLGALAGPAAYWSGARLGAASLPADTSISLLVFAVEWAIVLPLVALVALRLNPDAVEADA